MKRVLAGFSILIIILAIFIGIMNYRTDREKNKTFHNIDITSLEQVDEFETTVRWFGDGIKIRKYKLDNEIYKEIYKSIKTSELKIIEDNQIQYQLSYGITTLDDKLNKWLDELDSIKSGYYSMYYRTDPSSSLRYHNYDEIILDKDNLYLYLLNIDM